ncbi:MAG TPA: hypothetical protein VMJ32_15875 [Pirellulales bacterium]|nr:hypothetical protein [Pirellulales bacterium]
MVYSSLFLSQFFTAAAGVALTGLLSLGVLVLGAYGMLLLWQTGRRAARLRRSGA